MEWEGICSVDSFVAVVPVLTGESEVVGDGSVCGLVASVSLKLFRPVPPSHSGSGAIPPWIIVLATVLALHELWFTQPNHNNPVRFTTYNLRRFGLSRDQKWRALRFLEKIGQISIERMGTGKNPIVTLNSEPVRNSEKCCKNRAGLSDKSRTPVARIAHPAAILILCSSSLIP